MISFTPFASSSGGNMYTVSDGRTTLMLECGLPWKKARELLSFRTSEIAGILVSHSHMDHFKGIKDATAAGMDVYASAETFAFHSLANHRCHTIEDRRQFAIGTFRILPFATIHDREGALGFLLESGGEAFLFLTDSMYSPVKFPPLSVIAIEANNIEEILTAKILSGALPAAAGHRMRRAHMNLSTVVNMLKAADLSRCCAIYLLHLSNTNSDEAAMIRKVQEVCGVPVYACEA